VAEDILCAERGGQWLLSCYGPFKERKCIPGMDDVSPNEVRWEMYQAQKNGTADQIVQFFFAYFTFTYKTRSGV
jgi:nucleoporin-like protein 2